MNVFAETSVSVITEDPEILSAGYPDGGFWTSYSPVVTVAGKTIRPRPVDSPPHSDNVQVQIGYVIDE